MKQRLLVPGLLTIITWLVLLLASYPAWQKGMQLSGAFMPFLLALVFVMAFFLYWKAMRDGAVTASNLEVLGWTTALTLLLVLLFPFACEDVYYYMATGQLAEQYQANPYLTTAHQIKAWRLDPFLSTTNWGFLTSVYGPIWTKVAEWLVALTNHHFDLTVLIFKLFAGLVHLINTVLIGFTARNYGIKSSQAMLVYGWNPLLLFELPGHAHNDALLLTFIILAFYALTVRRGLFSLPFLTLAVLVKYTPVLLAPLFLCWLLKRRWFSSLLIGSLLSLVLVFIWWLPYWEGVTTLQGVVKQQNFYSIKSLHYILFTVAQGLWPTSEKVTSFAIISHVLTMVFLLIYFILLLRLWRKKSQHDLPILLTNTVLILLAFLVIANKWFQPWYLSWMLAAVPLLSWQSPLFTVSLLLSLTAELSRLPQMLLGHTHLAMHLLTFLVAWCPLLFYFCLPNGRFLRYSDGTRQEKTHE